MIEKYHEGCIVVIVPEDNNEKCNLKFKDDKLVYETFSAVFNTK